MELHEALNQAHKTVFAENVREERHQQDKKWGPQEHHPLLWVAILTEEIGEVSQAVLDLMNGELNKHNENTMRCLEEELVQVAAVASAFYECLQRGKWSHEKLAEGKFG